MNADKKEQKKIRRGIVKSVSFKPDTSAFIGTLPKGTVSGLIDELLRDYMLKQGTAISTGQSAGVPQKSSDYATAELVTGYTRKTLEEKLRETFGELHRYDLTIAEICEATGLTYSQVYYKVVPYLNIKKIYNICPPNCDDGTHGHGFH